MKKEAVLIFPHQLFDVHPALAINRDVFIIEHPRFFLDFKFHKQKLVLHRASLRAYADILKKKKYKITYMEFCETKKLELLLKKYAIVHCVDFSDHKLEKEITTLLKKRLKIYESPSFLTDRDTLTTMLSNKDHYVMNHFYIAQRKRLNILVSDGKPVGGKWSYDEQNRLKMPKNIPIPTSYHPKANKYIIEAKIYVQKNFKNNPGSLEIFNWPINHQQAKNALNDFLKHKFKQFGPYQDAIIKDEHFLFHSLLSSSLNNGLITPQVVIKETLAFAKKHPIPINSLEGFIRQIIGWREFIRGIYLIKGKTQAKQNFFHHKNNLAPSFWNGSTGISPIDITIQKVLKTAYTHHIERLMVLGNFMLLIETDPNQVYIWFMELFIDAYDWVMVPNVYGMSQYADGGMMTTKPYFSGSNYLKKMSNYSSGKWQEIWDNLYWRFIANQHKLIKSNARLNFMNVYLARMNPATLHEHIKHGNIFIKTLNNIKK